MLHQQYLLDISQRQERSAQELYIFILGQSWLYDRIVLHASQSPLAQSAHFPLNYEIGF